MNRAYSLLTIKSFDADRRMIRGIASTPEPDRTGDVVEPLGASFPPALPLLLHHRKEAPVGVARLHALPDGIAFEAELPVIETPGVVRDRVNEAWDSITAGLIRGVSIGFRVMDDAFEQLASGGLRFLKTEILELSLVTVPANRHATLAVIKELDLAASGLNTPGVTGTLPVVHARKDAPGMTTQEQITQWSNTRGPKSARMAELMAKAAETGVTLDEAQAEEYDGLEREIKSIDIHLGRLRAAEQVNVVTATPITATTQAQASDQRGGSSVIQVKSLLPKGTGFTRYAMAVAMSKGNLMQAAEIARQRWHDSTPEVELMCKAAVAAGTTTSATWAGPLVPAAQALVGEFLELLRPKTLIGKMPNLRKVPFNVAVAAQTAGGTYGWVGQGLAKPLTALAFSTVTLTFAKIAGIVVLTKELVQQSSPAAEETVRQDMIAGIAGFMDAQFIDPAVAEVANVNPASITNGIAPIVSVGTSADNARTDIKALIRTFVVANLSTENAILIMSEANAFALGVALNPLGQQLFPGLGANGGTVMGIPVITSQAAGTMVILVDQRGILYADEGGVSIDVSEEASLQMDSAPVTPPVAATIMVSLWQQNMVGLRAERQCTWKRARVSSVAHTSAAAYV